MCSEAIFYDSTFSMKRYIQTLTSQTCPYLFRDAITILQPQLFYAATDFMPIQTKRKILAALELFNLELI